MWGSDARMAKGRIIRPFFLAVWVPPLNLGDREQSKVKKLTKIIKNHMKWA